MDNTVKPSVTLRRTADEVKKFRNTVRITPIIAGAVALGLVLVYVISVLYSHYGAFTVSLDKFDQIDYALSLSETEDFLSQTSYLNSKASQKVTNIKGNSLPKNLDSPTGGSKNGENFVAYTWFLKNSGKKTITYAYRLYIANASNGIEEAVRVRLYVNGVENTFAKVKTDGSGDPEDGTTPFKTNTVISEEKIENFAPEDTTRFTVVIWLEGDDLDCVDSILGGQFKIDMNISVDGLEEENLEAKAFPCEGRGTACGG